MFVENNEAFYGGGCYNQGSSPSFNAVTFKANRNRDVLVTQYQGNCEDNCDGMFTLNKLGDGGGMYNDSASAVLSNVEFNLNTSRGKGGGMYNQNCSGNLELVGVKFIQNTGHLGGGMTNISSTPSLTNIVFSRNVAQGYGFIFSPDLIDNLGGAMYNDLSDVTMTNILFHENIADESQSCDGSLNPWFANGYGGGIYNLNCDPTIINATFFGNDAAGQGGHIYNHLSNAVLHNCLFYTFGGFDGSSGGTIKNGPFDNSDASVSGTNNFCDLISILNEAPEAFTQLGEDPFFEKFSVRGNDQIWATADDGLRPKKGSIIIDAGNDAENSEPNDIAGQQRMLGEAIDVGAYEYSSCNWSSEFRNGSWSNGVPNSSTLVLISQDYNTAEKGSINACTCTVAEGITLTINAGDYLKVAPHGIVLIGDLVVQEGGVVINETND